MQKLGKKLVAGFMTCVVCMSVSLPAFALGTNENSVGSVANDIEVDVITENDYGSGTVTGDDKTQEHETEYSSLEIANDTVDAATCDVYATQATGEDLVDGTEGTVMVVVPKVVILDGKTGTGKYVVKVKGNIAGNEVITIAPDATVTLEQTGKDNVVATISQAKTRFAYKDTTAIENADNLAKTVTTDYYTAPEATIQADGLSAGSWHGAFSFNISFAAVAA